MFSNPRQSHSKTPIPKNHPNKPRNNNTPPKPIQSQPRKEKEANEEHQGKASKQGKSRKSRETKKTMNHNSNRKQKQTETISPPPPLPARAHPQGSAKQRCVQLSPKDSASARRASARPRPSSWRKWGGPPMRETVVGVPLASGKPVERHVLISMRRKDGTCCVVVSMIL